MPKTPDPVQKPLCGCFADTDLSDATSAGCEHGLWTLAADGSWQAAQPATEAPPS